MASSNNRATMLGLRLRIATVTALVVSVCLTATGCGTNSSGSVAGTDFVALSPTEARGRLAAVVGMFSQTVKDTCEQCADGVDRREQRKNLLRLKLAAIEQARMSRSHDSPVTGFLDLWLLCMQLRDFVGEGGAGSALFGNQQSRIATTFSELVADMRAFANQHTPAESDAERLQTRLEEFATEHPMNDSFARRGLPPTAGMREKSGSFSWLTSLPGTINPFGSGLSEGAAAIQRAGVVAERFTDVVSHLPEETRWQLELLLYDIDQNPVFTDLTASTDAVAQSASEIAAAAEHIAETAAALPATIQKEVTATLEQLDRTEAVEKTLAEIRATASELRTTADSFGHTATNLQGMSESLDTTFQTFGQMLETLEGDPNAPAPPPDERARPFDVLDYDRTAQSLTAMAAQLEATLRNFRELIASGEVDTAVSASVDTASWTVLRTALLLFVAFFGCLLLYRLLAARFVR